MQFLSHAFDPMGWVHMFDAVQYIRFAKMLLLLALFTLCKYQQLLAEEDLPSISEVVAGFRQNMLAYQRVRMIHSTREQFHKDYRRLLEVNRDELVRRRSEKQVAEGELAAFDRLLASATKEMDDFKPAARTLAPIEVWRSGESVQLRFPPQDGESITPLTRQSLEQEFRNTEIISRSNSMEHWLAWGATQGAPKLTISKDCLLSSLGMPPLLADSVLPDNLLHPLDILGKAASKLTVIGREMVNGKSWLMLDEVVEMNLVPSSEFERRVKVKQIYRTWVDEQAGFWPCRMAYLTRYYLDGVEVANPVTSTNGYPATLDDVVLERGPSGVYYPISGVIRRWRVFGDPTWPTMEDIFVRGMARPVTTAVLLHETTWTTRVSMPDYTPEFDLMKIITSDTTIWRDGEFLVRDDQGVLIRGKAPALAHRSSTTHWIRITMCLLVMIALVGAIFGMKRRRKS